MHNNCSSFNFPPLNFRNNNFIPTNCREHLSNSFHLIFQLIQFTTHYDTPRLHQVVAT